MSEVTYVSNSGHDENGRYKYGAAGDQSGTEWHITPWFYFDQNVVLRHPRADVRATLAKLARAAANNNHIGYDHNERLTFWRELKKADYDPARINSYCESDCSAGVCALTLATGYILGIQEIIDSISPSGTTYDMVPAFQRAGFMTLTDRIYTRTGNNLLAGDININENQHTNIVVEGSGVYPSDDLDVDGWLGVRSITKMQMQLGTYVDGVVSGQFLGNEKYLERLIAIEWQGNGSPMVRKLQRKVGASVDGIAGRETVGKLQSWLNNRGESLNVDGYLGYWTACAIQRALNKGAFK